jgi:hypothetical protein
MLNADCEGVHEQIRKFAEGHWKIRRAASLKVDTVQRLCRPLAKIACESKIKAPLSMIEIKDRQPANGVKIKITG